MSITSGFLKAEPSRLAVDQPALLARIETLLEQIVRERETTSV